MALQKLSGCCADELLEAGAAALLLGLASSKLAGAAHSEAALHVVLGLARDSAQRRLACGAQGAVAELLRLAGDAAAQPEGVRRAALLCLAEVGGAGGAGGRARVQHGVLRQKTPGSAVAAK